MESAQVSNHQRISLREYAEEHPLLGVEDLSQWFEATYGQPISLNAVFDSLSAKYKTLTAPRDIYSTERKKQRIDDGPRVKQEPCSGVKQEAEEFDSGVRPETERDDGPVNIPSGVSGSDGVNGPANGPASGPRSGPHGAPTFQDGWLKGLKKRKPAYSRRGGYERVQLHQRQMDAVSQLLRYYPQEDVYILDETSLYWKQRPDIKVAAYDRTQMKKNMSHFTVLLGCNSDGSHKLAPWIIGHADRPRCFDAAKVNTESLGCVWRSNNNASVTTAIVREWLLEFDRNIAAQHPSRRVVLLMDNYSAHESAVTSLRNTTVCFTPPTMAERKMPFDWGVFANFKKHYHEKWLQYMFAEYHHKRDPLCTVNVLKAILWCVWAWQKVPQITIINSWFFYDVDPFHRSRDSEQPPRGSEEEGPLNDEIEGLMQKLAGKGPIKRPIGIRQFINPDDERVGERGQRSLEECLAERSVSQKHTRKKHTHESNEELENIPLVSNRKALASVNKSIQYLMQQGCMGPGLMYNLMQLRLQISQNLKDETDAAEFAAISV
ncbi:hypothetical protein JCM33374_g3495 [Metschnikowia sp. JCM 33374]|nr:hypothetical protein JCM33374_g3495 [Metschnikowia sp. JCM 33374]